MKLNRAKSITKKTKGETMKKQFTNDSNGNGFKHDDSTKKMGQSTIGSKHCSEKQAQCASDSKSTTQCKGCSSTKCQDKKACEARNCSNGKSMSGKSSNFGDSKKGTHRKQ